MTTITIPIQDSLNSFIEQQVSIGYASNKADFVRKAIQRMKEEILTDTLLIAQKEAKEGKLLKGDLDTLAEAYK